MPSIIDRPIQYTGSLNVGASRVSAQIHRSRDAVRLRLDNNQLAAPAVGSQAILSEQKRGRFIRLLEKIRRDSSHLQDQHDPEAAAFSVTADPQAVFDAINGRHDVMIADVDAQAGVAGQLESGF